MLKPIIEKIAVTWNNRFQQRMQQMHLSQRKFSMLYKKYFKGGSQSDVSKWMHIGEDTGKSKAGEGRKLRNFPEFETMVNIADILEVSVGYLIGETDYDTFEAERTSKYIGLSANAVEAIRALTSGKAIPPFYSCRWPDTERNAALELMLSSPYLVDYLKIICDLAEAMSREKNLSKSKYFDEAEASIPPQYRDDAISLWGDPEDAIEKGIKPTDEVWAFVHTLDDAACRDMAQPDIVDREIKASKYALQEAHMKMINGILSDPNIDKLLP